MASSIVWKVSVFGDFLVYFFLHLDWIRIDTGYLSVFSPNAGKYGPEKLQMQKLFTQWYFHSKSHYLWPKLRSSFWRHVTFMDIYDILALMAFNKINIYVLKVTNRYTKKRCELLSCFTLFYGALIVKFEQGFICWVLCLLHKVGKNCVDGYLFRTLSLYIQLNSYSRCSILKVIRRKPSKQFWINCKNTWKLDPKCSFLLGISSVDVTKPIRNCRFGHIY